VIDLSRYVITGTVKSRRLGYVSGQLHLQDDRKIVYCVYGGNVPFLKRPSLRFYGEADTLDEETSLDIPYQHDGHFIWSSLTKDNGLELYWESQEGDMGLVVPSALIDWDSWSYKMHQDVARMQEHNRRLIASRAYSKRRAALQATLRRVERPQTLQMAANARRAGIGPARAERAESMVDFGTAATLTAALLLLMQRSGA
jgi:hypothetical protein